MRMHRFLTLRFIGSMAFALAAVALMFTPLGVVSTLLAFPLCLWVPSLAETGPDVTWWFLGVMPRSAFAWTVFVVYFTILAYALGSAIALARRTSRKADTERDPVDPGPP